jgi:hypothetical protein
MSPLNLVGYCSDQLAALIALDAKKMRRVSGEPLHKN